jgi:hypothetical protein
MYYAFVTTAQARLDAPSTITLHTAPLVDVAAFAADFSIFDADLAGRSARLVLVDGAELGWQRARYREEACVLTPAHPMLVGLETLQQWIWRRLQAPPEVNVQQLAAIGEEIP